MAENRALWQETTGITPDEDTAVQLIAALHTPAVRDRIIADTINTDDDTEEFARTLIGQYTGRPNWNRVDAVQQLITDLLTHTPNQARAPLFVMFGWIHWYKGKGLMAHSYLIKALESESGHRLATLMLHLVGTGTLSKLPCDDPDPLQYQHGVIGVAARTRLSLHPCGWPAPDQCVVQVMAGIGRGQPTSATSRSSTSPRPFFEAREYSVASFFVISLRADFRQPITHPSSTPRVLGRD